MAKKISDNEKKMYLILHDWAQYSANYGGPYPLKWYIPFSGFLPRSFDEAFEFAKKRHKV